MLKNIISVLKLPA